MRIKHIKIQVPEQAHKTFKAKTAQNGTTMQKFLADAIIAYIGKKNPS